MSSASIGMDEVAIAPGEVVKIWLRHLLSLLFPISTLVFLWTGPHVWYVAPLYAIPFGIAMYVDQTAKVEKRQPLDSLPAWPFDALVYTLAVMQVIVVVETARMFSHQTVFSMDMAMIFVIVGGNSGFSIIAAHELIHRRPRWEQALGRLLLCTVLYEHFYTEHLRGHHVRVGTDRDPATARFGESYRAFWRRTVPAQFRSAWRLEARRLGDENMSLFDRRMLRNRILQGIVVGWGIAFALGLQFGHVAFVAHLLQAFVAVRLLEAVNYFEHWGLTRKGRRVQPADSWDTHSWFTYYGLTGLSRHADHHANPARPYQQLRVFNEAPVLPVGYVGLVDMVMARNTEFIDHAAGELERKRLGPFSDFDEVETEPERESRFAALREKAAAAVPSRLPGIFAKLPSWSGAVAFWATALVTLAFGGWLEAGGAVSFGARLAANAGILAIFAGLLIGRFQLALRTGKEGLSWALALGLLVVIGRMTENWLV
ncbi:MAG: alkane 1-monooxygenase [Deltaproteobacteria bacterium]|nr:alkane 1-monooxygenase [Deltaproteobacteria bacterium]